MSRRATPILKAGLTTLHALRIDRMLAPVAGGSGMILMLHHVRPEPPRAFEPNRILSVTPDFLETVISVVRKAGFETVSLDEAARRVAAVNAGETVRPFAAFTLDDGYRDNVRHALPVFRRHQVPFAVYAVTDFADGLGNLWWLNLEAAIRNLDAIDIDVSGERVKMTARTTLEKERAYNRLYWLLRNGCERHARNRIARLCRTAEHDINHYGQTLPMNWDELRELAREPLATIGAHTVGHFALARLSDADSAWEMEQSVKRIARELDRPVRHFSYPYGDPDSAGPREFAFARRLGLETAVTTRKGLLPRSGAIDPMALERLSLNGDYQDESYIRVLTSGVPFMLYRMAGRSRDGLGAAHRLSPAVTGLASASS